MDLPNHHSGHFLNVRGLLTLGTLGDLELDFLTFFQGLKAAIWIAEKCANKSSLPSSGLMKPKPLESLNHLTVPVAI